MGSEYRKPSASADEQYQHIPGVFSPPAVASQQGIPPGSEPIEEPSYREHGVNSSGQQPVEAPSFYPADLPDRQLQEERWQAPLAHSQQKNSAYPSNQGQHAYGAVPPVPVSLPRQGPVPYVPNPQYPPYMPNPQYAPYSQQYRSAPMPYTDPRAYQQPSNGVVQQSQPQARPGYPYQGPGYPYQGYYAPYGSPQGSYAGYPGYPPPSYPVYPYAWYPPRPRRSGYQLAMAITSLVGSILAVIAGILCGLVLLVVTLSNNAGLTGARLFASIVLYTALMLAGIVGGTFGIVHSSLALASKPSRPFKLPPFWSFLSIYVVLLAVGFIVGSSAVVDNVLLAFPLIALSGILPALTFFAFALRRLRRPETKEWPTTWRRITLALVSGATLATLLAIIFEGVLSVIAAVDNPGVLSSNVLNSNDPQAIIFTLTLVSIIAPIVEEGFKPLAVVVMIGRIRSAAEAFILGMACGIGFDLIETTSYMGLGYNHWIDVAIDRSTAGLLHGFGAGMMALGWYYITHKDALKRHHIQIGLGCMLYAILQHAIWNGSFVLQLLPAPIGPFLQSKIPIFDYQVEAFMIVYIVLSALMLWFLWFVTRKIRLQPDAPLGAKNKPGNQMNPAPAQVASVS